ncbi:MAG: MBL fold metallo-hydrolase [Methanobacteriota archaeon]|nr:MAG: MBL fold metallo-hydrolase [Euryarchaeota archaeon]
MEKLVGATLWEHHVLSPLSTNCFVFARSDEAVILDPGGPEAVSVAKQLKAKGFRIAHILITHGHFDHIGWAGDVKKVFPNAKTYVNIEEKEALPEFNTWPQKFGILSKQIADPDIWFEPDETLDIAGIQIKAIHTPGHTPGSTVYFIEDSRLAFTGDVLFNYSIGRTDFPFSDHMEMEKSLEKLIKILPEDVWFWPGHGPGSSIGFEKKHNPFLNP